MSTCSASSLRPSASASFPHLSITILRSFPNKKWRQCNLLHCPVGLPFARQQQIKSEQHRANRQKFTLLSLSISAAVDNNPDLPFPSFSLPKLQRLLPASGKQGLSVTVTDSQTCGFTTTTAAGIWTAVKVKILSQIQGLKHGPNPIRRVSDVFGFLHFLVWSGRVAFHPTFTSLKWDVSILSGATTMHTL